MKVVIASNNRHKIEEIKEILEKFNYELLSMKEAGLENFEIEETGVTFEENSYIKAKAVQDALGGITLADDSGLMVDALDGAPGVYSARYAGPESNDKDNNQKLLQALEKEEDRRAKFVSVITMLFPDGKKIVARGEVLGEILHEPVGSNGFGYDPLFFFPDLKKSFASLSSHEKNALSHRARALEKLQGALQNHA